MIDHNQIHSLIDAITELHSPTDAFRAQQHHGERTGETGIEIEGM